MAANRRTSERRKTLLGRTKSRAQSIDPVTAYLETSFAKGNSPKVIKVFSVFDNGNRKRVDVKDIPIIVRVLGIYPTDAEIQEIITQTEDDEFKGYVKLDAFLPAILKIMEDNKFPPESPEVLSQAFEFFDPKKRGFIEKEFFEHIMSISADDEEGIGNIEKKLEDIHKSMTMKVSLSDEKIPDDTPPPVEEVVDVKAKRRMMDEEEEMPEEPIIVKKVEPLNSDELQELMQIAVDKETNSVMYGDLILKFLSCQHFKESEI